MLPLHSLISVSTMSGVHGLAKLQTSHSDKAANLTGEYNKNRFLFLLTSQACNFVRLCTLDMVSTDTKLCEENNISM